MVGKQTVKIMVGLLLCLLLLPVAAFAAQTSSAHYELNEVFFGSGGSLNSCSTDYCSKQSAGELTVGNTASNDYQAQGGFNTDRTPYIQFMVNSTDIDLGTLSASSTQTATATFSVEAYLSHGYTVINASAPPTNGPHQLNPIAPIPAPSAVGTEQFGINLTANTVPSSFGSAPTQSPDSTFGYGYVPSDYDGTNYYKYAEGDVIAESDSSTSFTNYTISYIFNISHVTPGGEYTMHHVLVATATY